MNNALVAFLRLFLPIAGLIALGSLVLWQDSNSEPGALHLLSVATLLALFGLACWHIVTARSKQRASDERLKLLSDNLPKSYLYQYTHRADGSPQFLYLSSGVLAVHGFTAEAALADAGLLHGLTDPACLPALHQAQAESQQSLSDFQMEIRVRRPDASWGWLELRSRPHQTASGQIIWDGVATDVSETHTQQGTLELLARRTEVLRALPSLDEAYEEPEFLQHALDLMEQLTGSALGFIYFVNTDSNRIALAASSSRTLASHGQPADDEYYAITSAGLWAAAAHHGQAVISNDYAAGDNKDAPPHLAPLDRLLSMPVLEDGEVCMMTSLGNKLGDYDQADSETVQLISNEVWRIITKRRTEKALRIALQVVNASPVVCFRWRAEPDWPVVFVSDNIKQWSHSTEDMLAGHPCFTEMIHPDDRVRVIDEVIGYTANGLNTYLQEYRLITGDGQVIWVEARTIVLRDAAGRPLFYDGLLSDMSERKNRQEIMSGALAAQRQLNKRLEEAHNQLLQSEKMASIGQLAAGVAHELNNPIGFVHSNLGTLEGYLRDLMDIIDAYENYTRRLGAEARSCPSIEQLKDERDFNYVRQDIFNLLSESKDGLARVRKIVQDLKSFSHVGQQDWQAADLHRGIDSTLNIVWNELKYKCKVIKDYGDIPPVSCLISQLNQVFMNLLVNAGQAIETQGEIIIRTARHGADAVRIEICDNGKGIDAEHLNRIFEPFFTTKPVGKGTGLGLSLSYSIIERHHGHIEVDSEPGRGTCFRIILPIEHPSTARTDATTETAS